MRHVMLVKSSRLTDIFVDCLESVIVSYNDSSSLSLMSSEIYFDEVFFSLVGF